MASLLVTSYAFAASAQGSPDIQLNVQQTGPREVEEQTARAIARDYGAAWTALAAALDQNSTDRLGDLWAGFARRKFATAIEQQKQSGLRVRYAVGSHRLTGTFYSPEGSALELHDTAQIERQMLDGDTVISSEKLTQQFLVVMTPTADHWQVRVLQEIP